MNRYSAEQKAFLAVFIPGHTDKQAAEEFNSRFNTDIMTEGKIKSYKHNNKIKSGTKKGNPIGESKVFPREVFEFIKKNNYGKTCKEITALVNDRFGKTYTEHQIKTFRKNHNLISGINGKFTAGHIPTNKGKKGFYSPGCEKGWFQKGRKPHNYMAVGSEIKDHYGYRKIKTGEPNIWRYKHHLVWEKENGRIPENMIVIFKNNDKTDCRIENLMCISKVENAIINKKQFHVSDADITEAAINLAKVQHRISELQKKNKEN